MESVLIAIVAGVVQGLIIWGGMRVDLRYLRRDVDQAHKRIDKIDERCVQDRRGGYVPAGPGREL